MEKQRSWDWQYSPEAQRRIEFFDRVEQEVFNVFTIGVLGLAVTSQVDWQTAGIAWLSSAGSSSLEFKILKWITRLTDRDAVRVETPTQETNEIHLRRIGSGTIKTV